MTSTGKRCKHLHCVVVETAYEHINHRFVAGDLVSSYHSAGDTTKELWVECMDCGLRKQYYRNRLPGWLRRRMDGHVLWS